jgi:two-component system sensor histidine kinase UhpB
VLAPDSGWLPMLSDEAREDLPARQPVGLPRSSSLYWRLFGSNALVLIVAALALALSPATVSFPIRLDEAIILAGGILVILVINLVLMRRLLSPLGTLASTMRRVDPLAPGERVRLELHDRELAGLVASFNEMLERVEGERRSSALREAQARDDEQRRIAGELHDEIGQRLTVLLLQLANAQTDADQQTVVRLQDARDLAHEILDDLRAVVAGLRPAALDELGLTQGLSALASGIERRTGVSIVQHLDSIELDLPQVSSTVVYRVAQEALTNAVRHATGSPVRLELKQQADGSLRLRVADEGPGIPEDPQRNGGMGLRWMAERALLIGGTLAIETSPAGTTVTLNVFQDDAR